MQTLDHLEKLFTLAKKLDLIKSFEPIHSKDYFLVVLKPNTPESTKQALKAHIRATYRKVFFVTFGAYPNNDCLYIRYSDYE